MADVHAKQPIRTLVDGDVAVGILDTGDTRIDPAKEGGNLLSIKTNTDNLDVALSTVATEATLATLLTETDFDGRIGEVSATPTANTVLGRLKDISDNVTSTGSTLTDILAALGDPQANLSNHHSADIADGATNSAHTFTLSAAITGVIRSVLCAATGPAKFVVKVGGSTKWVAFTSETSPSFTIDCGGFEAAASSVIVVEKTNLDNQTLLCYSTVNYHEKA